MNGKYIILALTFLNIILIVTTSSVQSAYAQPDLGISFVRGNYIYDKPAIFKLEITNFGDATANAIKVNFVSVDDALIFTAKTQLSNALEPKERVDLEYEVIGKTLGLHEYYVTLSWEDPDGNKYIKDTKDTPLGYTVLSVVATQTAPILSMILIGAGVSIAAGVGIVFYTKRKQQSQIT